MSFCGLLRVTRHGVCGGKGLRSLCVAQVCVQSERAPRFSPPCSNPSFSQPVSVEGPDRVRVRLWEKELCPGRILLRPGWQRWAGQGWGQKD